MNLARLIVIALAVWVALTLFRRFFTPPTSPKTPQQTSTTKNMVRCAHCGLHLPESEAIAEGELFFCSQEHRRLHENPS